MTPGLHRLSTHRDGTGLCCGWLLGNPWSRCCSPVLHPKIYVHREGPYINIPVCRHNWVESDDKTPSPAQRQDEVHRPGPKKTQIEMEMLKAFIVSPTLCQTLLRLCCKPAMTVPMETGLLVHRVHLGRVAVVAGAAGANKGLLRKALMSIPDVPC